MRKGGIPFFLFLLPCLAPATLSRPAAAQDPAPLVEAAYTGRPMKVSLSTSIPRAFYMLLVSARPGPTPTPFGNLQVGLPFWVLARGRTDSSGKASPVVRVPPDPFLAGGRVHLAALFADTFGPVPRIRFSAGKALTLSGPLVLVSCGYSPPMAKPAVVFVDLLSMKVKGEIVLPRNPTRVVTGPYGVRGFVAAGRNLYILDIPGRKVSLVIRTAVNTDFTVLRRDLGGKWCFALAPGTTSLPKPSPGEVVALDMEKLAAKGPLTLSSQAVDIVPAPLRGKAWAVTGKDRMVHIVDGTSGKILKSVQVGRKGETRAFAAVGAGAMLEVSTGDWGGAKPATMGSVTEVDLQGKAGAAGMQASPVLPVAAVLWPGNPGYPRTGFLKNGTLAIVDLAARKVRTVLTLPRLYQGALHAVANPTRPAFLYCEKGSLWAGGKLR